MTGFEIAAAVAAVAGATSATVSGVKQHDATKRAERRAERAAKQNEVKPQMIEDDSKAVERAKRRNSLKQGRASTVLAGGYQGGGAKRLLGE